MTRVTFVSHVFDGLTLRGTEYLPDGNGPFPTVILHHGFGSMRMEALGLFVQLSRALVKRGIATVAFDRAGHGESDGDFFDTTVSGDIVTSVALIDVVSGWPEVDADNLHLLGMSMGSVVASIAAAETFHPIASLTLLSPAAVFVDDIRSGTMHGRSTQDVAAQGYVEHGVNLLGAAFFDDGRDFDVYGRAAGYHGPVRIIHGGNDEVVPTAYALRYGDIYDRPADITIVPGADHVWSQRATREILLEAAVTFVARQVEIARAG